MIKALLVCDSCGAVIADGISPSEMRFQAQALYRRREGKDLCLACEGAAGSSATPVQPRLLRSQAGGNPSQGLRSLRDFEPSTYAAESSP